MAYAKARKTFKYLGDEDGIAASSIVDEQEQEQIIETLAIQDASMTAVYKVCRHHCSSTLA